MSQLLEILVLNKLNGSRKVVKLDGRTTLYDLFTAVAGLDELDVNEVHLMHEGVALSRDSNVRIEDTALLTEPEVVMSINMHKIELEKRNIDISVDSLFLALVRDANDVVEMLLECGVGVHAGKLKHSWVGSKYRKAPLHIAASRGNATAVSLLVEKGADIEVKDADGDTPLHAAINLETAAFLIEKGANVNAENKDQRSPLFFAAFRESTKVMTLLIEKGASVSARDSNRKTPLHTAAYWDRPKAVALLLQNNAAINARGLDGRTPLHNAASMGAAEALKVLLQHDAKVNVKDCEGQPPLHDAVCADSIGTARLLLCAGADAGARCQKGYSARDHAVRTGNRSMLRLITQFRGCGCY